MASGAPPIIRRSNPPPPPRPIPVRSRLQPPPPLPDRARLPLRSAALPHPQLRRPHRQRLLSPRPPRSFSRTRNRPMGDGPSPQAPSRRFRLKAFADAWNGIVVVVRTQPNARIHLAATVAAVVLAGWLGLTAGEWSALVCAI